MFVVPRLVSPGTPVRPIKMPVGQRAGDPQQIHPFPGRPARRPLADRVRFGKADVVITACSRASSAVCARAPGTIDVSTAAQY